MHEPQLPATPPEDTDQPVTAGPDVPVAETPQGWTRRTVAGTALLVGLLAAVGLFATTR